MIEVSPDLLTFLREEEERSRNIDLLNRAETALKSYNGEFYGDEVDGCSKVVSRDVAEVVDHMNVSVLRTFVSGDRVVEFEPDTEEHEQFADDATEAIQRQFQRKGYSLLHDWLKEGNISTLGIVKACVERKHERVEAHVPAMLMGLAEHLPDGVRVIEADDPQVDEADGIEKQRVAALVEQPAQFKDYLVPLEEFRISPDARDVDEAAYVAHACWKTLSELVEMGFEDVENVQGDEWTEQLSQVRDRNRSFLGETRSGPMRRVVLMEEYVRFDADGDGIAERLCIHRVGNTVLRIEPSDYQPFVIYCPFPMPGRIGGHSLADKVTDIQRINTALMRLMLDGSYRNLAPRTYVDESSVTANTYDDLLTVIPGGLVRYKNTPPVPEPKNDVSANAMQAIEFMIAQREGRTGITRHNQGLDADTLNHTATGMALQQAAGQNIEEYLARNFAEAVAKLMLLKLKMMVRYGGPQSLRVDGTYKQIDPSQWPEDMNVVIRVGLGSGRKDQRLANRMNLLQIQRECLLGGLDIVGPEQIYKSISGVVKDANLGSPADFVLDPSSEEYQQMQAQKPPQQDPEAMKVQAELQMQQQKHEADAQLKGADLQAKQQEGALKLELEREKATEAAQLARDKAEFEREQAVEQMVFEREMAQQRLAHEHQLAFYKADQDAEAKKYRDGGSLAA